MFFPPAAYENNEPPFNDPRVRQAVSLSIDREALIGLASGDTRRQEAQPDQRRLPLVPRPGQLRHGRRGEVLQARRAERRSSCCARPATTRWTSTSTTRTTPTSPPCRTTTLSPKRSRRCCATPASTRRSSRTTTSPSGSIPSGGIFYGGLKNGIAFALETPVNHPWIQFNFEFTPGNSRNHSHINDADIISLVNQLGDESDFDKGRDLAYQIQKMNGEKMYYVPLVGPYGFARVSVVHAGVGGAHELRPRLRVCAVLPDRHDKAAALANGATGAGRTSGPLSRRHDHIPHPAPAADAPHAVHRHGDGLPDRARAARRRGRGDHRPVHAADAGRSSEAVKHDLGLDRPWYEQYGDFVGGALTGDFGRRCSRSSPITDDLKDRLPVSVELGADGDSSSLSSSPCPWACSPPSGRTPSSITSRAARRSRCSPSRASGSPRWCIVYPNVWWNWAPPSVSHTSSRTRGQTSRFFIIPALDPRRRALRRRHAADAGANAGGVAAGLRPHGVGEGAAGAQRGRRATR